jgi:hypothetical protein
MADNSPGKKPVSRRPHVWLATVATLIGIATGVLTLRNELFPRDEPVAADSTSIPYFDDIVSHLERSRDFIGFLQKHDTDAVKLQVGFQLSPDDYAAKGLGSLAPGDDSDAANIVLYTECRPPLTAAERRQVELGFTRKILGYGRCTGDELVIGKDTDESGIYVTHGNPRLEGYFRVNVGDMHQGFVGIVLHPITRGEA